MKQPTLPSYASLKAELDKTGAEIHISEIHGLIAGALCADTDGQKGWTHLVKAGQLPTEMHTTLHELYDSDEGQLRDFLFEYNLLLPLDDEPLALRAEALTAWCQGFLVGLKLYGVPIEARKPSELTEAINDLIEIAKMNYEQVVPSEEDEAAYIELVEYVRMAVILIYQELRSPNDVTAASPLLH